MKKFCAIFILKKLLNQKLLTFFIIFLFNFFFFAQSFFNSWGNLCKILRDAKFSRKTPQYGMFHVYNEPSRLKLTWRNIDKKFKFNPLLEVPYRVYFARCEMEKKTSHPLAK